MPARCSKWGTSSASLPGFALAGEKEVAILRAECLFAGGKAYGLRSSPA
jgi:hypothetical protein